MTSDGHKKFMFDTDFAPEAVIKAQKDAELQAQLEAERAAAQAKATEETEAALEDAPPTFSEEDVERARKEGFQAGHTEATRDLTSALEQRVANTLDAINVHVASLFEAYEEDKEEHNRDAVAVATVIVRKLFPALNMEHALAEIEHMIIEAMSRTSGAPSLVVRVPPSIRDSVDVKARELSVLRGREGTLTVMADETLAEGDAAVEWDGGGMVRDSKMMWQVIDEIIERNLGNERANGGYKGTVEQVDGGDIEAVGEEAPPPTQEVENKTTVGENTETAPESPDLAASADASAEAPQPVDTEEQTAPIETPGTDQPDDTNVDTQTDTDTNTGD